MKRARRTGVVAAIAILAWGGSALADKKWKCEAPTAVKSACQLGADVTWKIVKYFGGPPTRADDHKCTGTECCLWGWLYVPRKLATQAAVVYLHGHDRERNEPCAIAREFTENGYAVFAPLRNGNVGNDPAGKPAFTNSGDYIDDWAKAQGGDPDQNSVRYLRDDQIHDVEHALMFLTSQPLPGAGGLVLSAGRIGILGHSYGGALAVFASGGDLKVNPQVIADVSGAELSWRDDGPWAGPLRAAVRKRKVPIYFLQPSNGKSLQPTIALSHEAATSGDTELEAAIFPAVDEKTEKEVHRAFVGDERYVSRWAPSVRDFFNRYFARIPARPHGVASAPKP